MSEKQLHRGLVSADVRRDLGEDDSGCNILHVDMDAFFAMVELRDRPDLLGKPVIVGRSGGRGVVVSCTYEARARGIHSAMPMSRAHRLFPNAIYLEPSYGKYGPASKEVMAILRDFTPDVEQVSVDEAFLNVASVARSIGSPGAIARMIRQRVSSELNLPCSVGVAPVTLVAKIASTQSKPNGLLIIPKARMVDFLHSLPVGKLWGVGASTEERLKSVGVVTVGDLAEMPETRLSRVVGKASASRLHSLAMGRELRPVSPGTREKSISAEHTFERDVTSSAVIEQAMRSETERVAQRLRKAEFKARGVTIKVRFEDFSTITRSSTLTEPTDLATDLFTAARNLWLKLKVNGRPVRLIGVKADHLASSETIGTQLTFDEADEHRAQAEKAIDKVAEKFGSGALIPARMVNNSAGEK